MSCDNFGRPSGEYPLGRSGVWPTCGSPGGYLPPFATIGGVENRAAPSASPGGPRAGGHLGELLVQHLYSALLALFGGLHPHMGGGASTVANW